MTQEHENEIGDTRYAFIYEGPIVDRNDPLQLGRVKVRIPGICEPSTTWALPVGTGNGGGGVGQRGTKMVPPIGAEVAVYFKGGDPDQPRYIPGHWGVGEMPTDSQIDPNDGTTKLTPSTSPDVHCFEFARYKMTIDERAGKPGSFTITDKISGDMVQLDGSGPGILVQGSAAVVIKSDGMIVLDATSVVIKGRPVSDGGQSI